MRRERVGLLGSLVSYAPLARPTLQFRRFFPSPLQFEAIHSRTDRFAQRWAKAGARGVFFAQLTDFSLSGSCTPLQSTAVRTDATRHSSDTAARHRGSGV